MADPSYPHGPPPAYDKPGQPAYGQPAYGQPAYGQPAYGQPAYGQPAYGQPAYGQPAYGQPVYGQTFVVTTAPVAGAALTRETGPPPDTTAGLIVSILVCIFCAWPCGIGAIIYNRKANTMVELGQYSVARENLKTMWIFVAVSVIIGLCWLGYVLGTYI